MWAVRNPIHHWASPAMSNANATPQGMPKLPVQNEFRCMTVPTTPVMIPTTTASGIDQMLSRVSGFLGFGACPSAGEFDPVIGVDDHLSHPDRLRCDFNPFVVAYPFQGSFQRESSSAGAPY